MSRIISEAQRRLHSPESRVSSQSVDHAMQARAAWASNRAWDFWVVRAFLMACTGGVSYTLAPLGLRGWQAAGVGFLMGLVVLLAELRLRQAALGGLLGGAFGAVLGVFAALLVTLVISRTDEREPTKSFLEFAALFAFGYLGLVLGVPQFVLHELQMVADSADPLKRQRGRRGLEVLQRIQKMPRVKVRILEEDFPQAGDVDHKLVELARRTGAKIITNDFNLNKVATVQGLSVLNVNQLAHVLKPVVLPGEPMRVLILREGKEANQGVAYLDDGTMVVVDGARRMIKKSVDIIVTSVH